MADPKFHDLELLNINIDIWIDDEDYKKVYKSIQLNSESLIDRRIKNFSRDSDIFPPSFKIGKNPEQAIQHIKNHNNEVLISGKANNNWKPLFFAKYLRAKIQENGTDNYTKHLGDLVIYLQRKLPYQSPKKDEEEELILQHLYFQELSACGMPGLESLGFALQAYNLVKDKKDTKDGSHYSFELYKLWAKYNQGIGYVHSGQKMEAADAFNEIIRGFLKENSCLRFDGAKKCWQSLLCDQAVLFKAELLEDLQFSYHTVQSLGKLDGRKKENSLIKKALAYRDMGRLKEAKKKIQELLSRADAKRIKKIFEAVESWEIGKKKNIKSKTLGLLFDYYLLEFEEKKDVAHNDISSFIQQFKKHKDAFIRSKTERVSYYQQVARFLKWLSGKHYEEINKKSKNKFYFEKIKELYEHLENFLLPGKLNTQEYSVRLKDFDKYDYDRYTDSMEKFFKNLTDSDSSDYKKDEKDFLDKLKKDEKYLLLTLNEYEKERSFLFKFKELERKQRINRLKNGLHEENCEKQRKCFRQNPDNSIAFDGVLECLKTSTSSEKNKTTKDKKNTDTRGSEHPDIRFGPLIDNDYETIMERENSRFLDYLAYKSRHPIYYPKEGTIEKSYHFMGLQRWNSQTPTLTLSQGGGYLLYEQDKHGKVALGIAIDPGFDFVDNLFHMGFTLNDIDFILLSHAHLDHIRDFEPIISSLLDLKKRKNDSHKKIHAMMTWGVYKQLEHVITNPTLREFLADTYIVDIDKDLQLEEPPKPFSFLKDPESPNNKNIFVSITQDDDSRKKYIEICPTQAYHNDYSEKSDSYGYIINFYDDNDAENKQAFSFGYTGDTKWHDGKFRQDGIPGIYEQYEKCNAVCIHLGALIESEKPEKANFSYYNGQHCEELIEKKRHLYLFGLLRYLKKIQESGYENKLLLISEFGEELKGGIRIDFIRRLNDLFKIIRTATEKDPMEGEARDQSPVCLPVDIGLNVILAWSWCDKKEKPESKEEWGGSPPYKVWCYGCEKFVDAKKIRYRHFGYGNNDEALFYFCKVCLKSKPENAIQDRMRLICESGVSLEKADE